MGRMKRSKTRAWKLLLLIHLICYEAFFVIALANFNRAWYVVQNNFIVLLFWTALLLVHVGATYYQVGRGDISRLEREAYREGFTDAVRQLANRSYDAARLALDDEGELVELPEKRKHSEI